MNPWYVFTYETILGLANWSAFDAEIERKVVGVFSWMPMIIMNVKYQGNQRRCDVFSIDDVREAASNSSVFVSELDRLTLQGIVIDDHVDDLIAAFAPMFNVFGSVGASKYFHFSRPLLFPMWDKEMRERAHLPDSPDGFVDYMRLFQAELEVPENFDLARAEYSPNVVRGWDIVRMRNRGG